MLKKIIMSCSLLILASLYVTANVLPLNGLMTWEIAYQLPVLFIPSSFISVIWFVIYILFGYWIYRFDQDTMNSSSRIVTMRFGLFTAICTLQSIWIFLWHYGFYGSALFVKAALLVLLAALYFTYSKYSSRFTGRIPVAVCFAWVFITTFVNLTYWLILHEWSGLGLSDPLWSVIYLTITALFALHFMYHHKDTAINIVILWAFFGIAIHNGIDELFVAAASVFLMAAIAAGMFTFKNHSSAAIDKEKEKSRKLVTKFKSSKKRAGNLIK